MTSIDKIVRGVLLQKGLSIHFYITYLVYARDCLRELSMDCLKTVNYKLLTLDEWNEAEIPCDFLDDVGVGYEVGQLIRPLVKDNGLNSLVNYDSQGNRISFDERTLSSNPRDNYLYGQENIDYGAALYWGNGWNYTTVDDYGEALGRMYGYRNNKSDTYKIIRDRNVIKINEDISNTGKFVLTYIGDGTDCDAASMITPYAISTIEAYIKWQSRENNRSYGLGESKNAENEFLKQRRFLIGRLSDIGSTNDILRAMQKGYYNSQKV